MLKIANRGIGCVIDNKMKFERWRNGQSEGEVGEIKGFLFCKRWKKTPYTNNNY